MKKNELESIKFRPKAIRRSVLKETNRYRDLHNARPLKMDENLTSYAQEWADHLACNNLLETRPLPLYGQNIICARKELFAVNQIMKLWYQEKYNYDYFKPEFDLYTGHFTQMVWRETEFLGVGVSSNDSRIWIVCNFNPPGNITGHFKENVHPRKTFFPASNFEDEQETHKSQETIFNEGKSVKFSLAKKSSPNSQ
ncbi:Golgi-associated plant pathogenesis-related protein 1 isoform X1 [Drosophila ficusphila]|uniref:Golgi-associated plant pathogenesis-related protein 1 isoform X1 n=2 Tax=Drosophila ficusphila TaxID=30025 RepID=UPI001C8A335C|nr:Golgi-associated plant pathogenesis-related protein 1 isoform X1 [Drosophila ficusphila]